MENVIASHVQDKSHEILVDYGSGNSPYRQIFGDHITQYLRCDLPGNADADIDLGPEGQIPLPNGSVDVVLSSQVLEHVSEPSRYLQEARRVLKPEGMLILSTHGMWVYHPDPCDFWRWTRRTIESEGFEILDWRAVMAPASYAVQLWQDSVYPRLPRWTRQCFFFSMQYLVQWFDQWSYEGARSRNGSVFVVVARPSNGNTESNGSV